jgi:hypothetical protein
LDFQKKLIKIFTISIFYLKLKENIENDVAAHAFLSVFCSSRQPSQIGPTAENDSAAVYFPYIFLLIRYLSNDDS